MKFVTEQMKRFANVQWLALALLVLFALPILAQETTGGLQGTVKDPSGALVPGATVTLSSSNMLGSKVLVTDSSGYYRFANLSPGIYTLTVTAGGFETTKREGLQIQVGHLPSVELTLKVGSAAQTVEVTGSAPVIDTTTTQNITNVSQQQLENLPTGISFQSVIQFAPMARDEPLSGMQSAGHGIGGSGGSMPGSSGNGQSFGYSIGGAADSESSYLIEGQDTENISGGYSKANVPMDFIQEVEMKTSGVAAEYGGALGGVVNVILKKGSNEFHGSLFSTYESSGTDANPVNAYLRYDPTSAGNASIRQDPNPQIYSPQKGHFRTVEPGGIVEGPILKDRLWFTLGFEPLVQARARTVNFGTFDNNAGNQYFTQDRQQYFGYARIDAALTSKIRVYGSWLYQYARETGDEMPTADPTASEAGFVNTAIEAPLAQYNHGLGWAAPNATYNTGADITLTQHLVSTTRFGYFFDNYHDFGWPTSEPDIVWNNNGSGACDNTNTTGYEACPGGGAPLPGNLALGAGTSTQPYLSSYTLENADKHYQLNQDVAFYKGGAWGTHNLKFGYQLNHLVNSISQNGNVPYAFLTLGTGASYSALTTTGGDNCGNAPADDGTGGNGLEGHWYTVNTAAPPKYVGTCAGQYGYLTVQDFSTILTAPASDWNHAFYAQDDWTVGHGLTLNLGLRIEKESLPAPAGVKVPAINFSWSDKIAPRLGAAWDPSGRGKMKFFGSYGVVNDVMKLLLAQTSWGAQSYEQCSYPLGPDGSGGFDISDLNITFKGDRACPNGVASTQANFTSSNPPPSLVDAGSGSVKNVSIIENVNYRPWEPVAPNVKPYRQHEYVAGFDFQLNSKLAFEARYDRRRLDHVIEDASLSDKAWGEMFAVVNPGEGVNATIDSYATYLAGLGQAFGVPGQAFSDTASFGPGVAFGTCPSCPQNAKAVRNYDGLEFRLMVAQTHGLSGMFSYSYSSLFGNYTGLTTTDQSDGGVTGRNSPDTTRAFDEPYYYFGENGKSNNGKLPTDRPNVLKGYGYYTLPWGKHHVTTFGIFQEFLQGTPLGSYFDIGAATTGQPYDGVFAWGRDQWVDVTTNTSGVMSFSAPHIKRTPWYVQSDLNASHEVKFGDRNSVGFEVTAQNAFNQRAVASIFESIDSWNFPVSTRPGGLSIAHGAASYQAYETGYSASGILNARPVVLNSQYGKPYLFQNGRSVRLGMHFKF